MPCFRCPAGRGSGIDRGVLAFLPLLVALFAPPPAVPDEASSSEAESEAEVLEVHGRRLRRDGRDGGLATVVIEVGSDPRPLTELGAVVERAAGVRVVRSGGGSETVQMRGAAGHQGGVWVDGVPLDDARGEAVDLGLLPPALFDRVEVVRGAAGAAYGGGAQGGVLHLRTRRFEQGGGPVAGEVAVRGGSFGLAQVDGGVGGGGAAGDGLAAVSLSRATGDFAFVDAQGRAGTRLNNDHQRGSLLLRGRWRPAAGVEVGGLLLGTLAERGEPGRDAFPDGDARLDRRSGLGLGFVEGDAWAGQVGWGGRVWVRQRRQVFVDPVASYADPQRSALVDDSSGVAAWAAWDGAAWHRPMVVLEGRLARAVSEVSGVGGEVGAEARDERRAGGAVVAGWEVEPVMGLRAVGLLRFDAQSGRAGWWVPKLGLVAEPWGEAAGLVLRANAGRLFRDPGFDELYFVGQGIRGNPALRPETGWGVDAGVGWSRWGWSLDVQGFMQRYERLIAFVPIDAYRVGARDDFAAVVAGVEAAVRFEGAWWLVEGTWLGQRARFVTDPVAPLPYRPGHRVGGLGQVTVGPVTPFVGGRWQSGVTVDRFGARRQAGYGLLDVGLRAGLPGGLAAAVEVENLLGREGAFDVAQRPLPGRSVVVEVWGGWP